MVNNSSADSKKYKEAKKSLKEHVSELYKDKSNTYVISISRKGPKLLEYLFQDDQKMLENSNTLTEYSLPFLFHQLSQQEEGEYKLCLVDDAIYYGTTMKKLERETYAYAKRFGVKVEVQCYAAISDKDASPLMQGVIAEKPERNGYGHYFIKRLTSDIRSLHNTFEVEFPSISFVYVRDIDIKAMIKAFAEVYGKENVYHISHDENDSINVLLPNADKTLFSKLRIYPDNKRHILNVACLAPRIIKNWDHDIKHLFDGNPLESLWQEILIKSELPSISEQSPMDEFINNEYLEQDRNRCLIVLANYLLSFGTFIQQKTSLKQAFELLNDKFDYVGISNQQINYLVANRVLSQAIKEKLNEVYYNNIFYTSELSQPLDGQDGIVVSSDGMTEEELAVLDNQNQLLLRKCQNLQEALSALVFNLAIMVEKRMRRISFYNFYRLHFGYTFSAFITNIRKYVPFELGDDTTLLLHKWIDQRIDKGCLVPQYIETKSGNWLRVFRSGENEDEILSHLARYALLVFKKTDTILRLGWVPLNVFRKLLSISYFDAGEDLEKALGIQFKLIKNQLCFKNNDQTEYRELTDYLLNMYIFISENDKIRISAHLVDEELMQNTTLDSEVERRIEQKIEKVLNNFKEFETPLNQAFLILNYHLYNPKDRLDAQNAMKLVVENALKSIKWNKEHLQDNDNMAYRNWITVHQGYMDLMDYIIDAKFWTSEQYLSSLSDDREIQKKIYTEQKRMHSLILELEILLSIFFISDEVLTGNVLKEILDPSENPSSNISENVLEKTKILLEDYYSIEKREWLLQAISLDLPRFLYDE